MICYEKKVIRFGNQKVILRGLLESKSDSKLITSAGLYNIHDFGFIDHSVENDIRFFLWDELSEQCLNYVFNFGQKNNRVKDDTYRPGMKKFVQHKPRLARINRLNPVNTERGRRIKNTFKPYFNGLTEQNEEVKFEMFLELLNMFIQVCIKIYLDNDPNMSSLVMHFKKSVLARFF